MFGFLCFVLMAALIWLSVFDIWKDIKAAHMANRFDISAHFFGNPAECATMMDVINTLADCAPNPSQNYYGWTTTESRQGWFEESGIRSMSLQETGLSLLVRIDRGTTLQDEVVFNIRDGMLSDLSVTFRWHGRLLPLFSKSEHVVRGDEKCSVGTVAKQIGSSRIACDLYATMRYAEGVKVWMRSHEHA